MFVIFDSSFDGLLSAAAFCFRRRLRPDGLLSVLEPQPIVESVEVPCEANIRRLFRRHLCRLLGQGAGEAVLDAVYRAFLSESEGIASSIWRYLEIALTSRQDPAGRLYEPAVAAVAGAALKVSGQAHQYLGLLRFRSLGPDFFLADFTPDYHVLPLILPHFCDRLPDQNFAIRDLRRGLAALHQAGGRVSLHLLATDSPADETGAFRTLAAPPALAAGPAPQDKTGAGTGEAYDAMWRLYLQHLSIPERRNPGLQRANMPKKYWKYLSEDPGAYK